MAERIPVFWDFNNIKLKQAQRELDRTRAKTRQLQGSANVLGKTFKTLGTTLLATFGAVAVLAAFRNMLKSLKDLEFQMSKVAAISGATSKQMVQLRNNAIKVGAASKFTATEVGKLQEELARLGFTTTEILKLTDSISALAIVADTELRPTAIAVAKTLNAFALSAEEGARVTNVMAESFAKSALDLEKFRSAMANVGPLARVAGLSIEETTAILGTFIDNGIEASKAGTDLRRILLNVSLAGITLDEALEKLATSTDKVSTAEELFGARAAVAGILLQENSLSIEEFTRQLSDSTREIDRMRRIMEDNLEVDLAKLRSAFDALVQKGTPLNDLLRDIVNRLRDWVNVIGDVEPTINDMKDQIAKTEQQIEKLKKQFKDSGFGLDIYGSKAREAEGILHKLRLEVINLKLEISAKEFLEGVKIAENAKIIEAAFKAAFASDDIEEFIKNLEETEQKEEIIAIIRREQKLRLEEENLLKAEQKELQDERLKQLEEEAKILKANTDAANKLFLFRLMLGIISTKSIEERIAAEILLEQEKANILLENEELLADERILIEEQLQAKILEIKQKGQDDIDELEEEKAEKDRKRRQKEIDERISQEEIIRDIERETEEIRKEIQLRSIELTENFLGSLASLAKEGSALEIALLVFEKLAAITRVITATGQQIAIASLHIELAVPEPITAAILIAARTAQIKTLAAINIASIAATAIPKFAGFKEGVIDYQGQGTETSDSNLVWMSNRESMIKASATKKSPKLLEAINSERLNDELADILLSSKIGSPGNENVVAALMGVDKSIKGLPIHQTYFSDKGVARYIQKENSRVMLLRSRYIN